MSLCLYKQLSDDLIYVAADSRACAYDAKGTSFVASDDATKIHAIGNDTLLFGSGVAQILDSIIADYKKSVNKSVNSLALFAKKHTNAYLSSGGKLPPNIKADGLVTALFVVRASMGVIHKYVIINCNNYAPIHIPNMAGEVGSIGLDNCNTDVLRNATSSDVLEAMQNVYCNENSYQIGGSATVYSFTGDGIRTRHDFQIADKQEYIRVALATQQMSLKGMVITNQNNQKSFEVDSNGNVSMVGNITLGAGSSINWNYVNSDPIATNARDTANSANSLANTANSQANNAYNLANTANNNASAADQLARRIANGTFSGGTFINGREIYSPTIYADEFVVKPSSTISKTGGYSIYGNYGNNTYSMFRLSYFAGDAPYINFDSPAGAYANWNFNVSHFGNSGSNTNFYGNVNFNGANVTGLYATFA